MSTGSSTWVRHLELEAHIRGCTACRLAAENAQGRRAALRASLPRYSARPELAARVRAALRSEGGAHRLAGRVFAARNRPGPRGTASASAASLAFGDPGRVRVGPRPCAPRRPLRRGAVSEHVRLLRANHLMDVSTDQHTVKPCSAGKLEILAARGRPRLLGLPAHGRAARAHRRPSRGRRSSTTAGSMPSICSSGRPRSRSPLGTRPQDGYNAESWSQVGLNFIAVSEIPADELARFAAAYRDDTR